MRTLSTSFGVVCAKALAASRMARASPSLVSELAGGALRARNGQTACRSFPWVLDKSADRQAGAHHHLGDRTSLASGCAQDQDGRPAGLLLQTCGPQWVRLPPRLRP
jgi:hypothetical protein